MSTHVMKLLNLSGRTALITGGSRGLGLQLAESLGEAGARIVITSRKAPDLEAAAAALTSRGIDAQWIAGDAARPDQVEYVCTEALNRLKQSDILVNNAGTSWAAPAESHPIEAWDKVINLNIRSAFWFSQAIGRAA
jgi:NAD(P)-dependent dehydrogenase (short-subunit alcohol dehydrogenase family)